MPQEVDRFKGDPHSFRFVISPENGVEVEIESVVKEVMKRVESDLQTKLEWYAISHLGIDNHHAHVLIRGVDDRGKRLVKGRKAGISAASSWSRR